MTTKPNASRSDLVRQRRTSRQSSTQASQKRAAQPARRTVSSAREVYHPRSVYLPGEPRRVAPRASRSAARRTGYDFAFTLGRADVRAPGLSIPQLGARWVSGALTLLLGFLIYTLSTASTFTVSAADVVGNQRLSAAELNAMLGVNGQPVFKAVPAQIMVNLRTTFHDLASVKVHVGFPNHITVEVVERAPALAWYQDNVVTWIDANGVAFMPRGDVQGLIQIAANGSPVEVQNDPSKPVYDQPFIEPEMVKAIFNLAPYVPGGAPMIYDPRYGMGWQDPRGWFVYYGQNTLDIPMKLKVYQAIVDTFVRQGIQPTLISVEYLNAPFYK